MDKFIIDGNYLVLSKDVKKSKDNKDYFSISLYDKVNDGFEKILLFDKNIFERYDVMKTYNMKIEVTFYNNKKRLRIL